MGKVVLAPSGWLSVAFRGLLARVALVLAFALILGQARAQVSAPEAFSCSEQTNLKVSSELLDRLQEPGFAYIESAKSYVLAHPEALCSLRQMAAYLMTMDASGLSSEQAQYAQELLRRILLILQSTET